jgi:hypothetical protein
VSRAVGRERREYARGRPPGQHENPIMQAVAHDRDGLITLFRMIAPKL